MAIDAPFPVHLAEYLGVRGAAAFMQCFDIDQNLHSAALVGSAFYRLNRRRRERACANLQRSFPDWSPTRVERVVKRSMQNMFQLFLVDAPMMHRLITPSTWTQHLRIGSLGPMLERLVRDEPLLLLTGHCGNWELLGYYLSVIGYPIAALARPLDNPLLNRWLLGMRQARGMRIITKWGATTELQSVLDDGGRVGFIADQNAGDQGLFVPFFGRLASSYKSIGLLALRYELPVAAGFACRLGGKFQYELSCVDYIEPGDWADQPDPLFYITARYNRAMETMIRQAPEQYLWLHRRWKSRPKHEREGKPIPARLQDKLRALPWMTEDDVQRMVEESREMAATHRG